MKINHDQSFSFGWAVFSVGGGRCTTSPSNVPPPVEGVGAMAFRGSVGYLSNQRLRRQVAHQHMKMQSKLVASRAMPWDQARRSFCSMRTAVSPEYEQRDHRDDLRAGSRGDAEYRIAEFPADQQQPSAVDSPVRFATAKVDVKTGERRSPDTMRDA